MIDIKLFKDILTEKIQSGYIDNSDLITIELLELFEDYGNMPKIKALFAPVPNNINYNYLYKIEFVCMKCDSLDIVTMSKTKLFEYISSSKKPDGDNYFCDSCYKKVTRLKKKESKKEEIKYKKEIENKIKENTIEYIKYLDPESKWNKEITARQRLNLITQNYYLNNEKICVEIKKLKYKEFLKTPYWKTIAEHVKYRAKYMCKLCNSKTNLITHHNNYKRHGQEHLYWKEDLICICNSCHLKQHNIIEEY